MRKILRVGDRRIFIGTCFHPELLKARKIESEVGFCDANAFSSLAANNGQLMKNYACPPRVD